MLVHLRLLQLFFKSTMQLRRRLSKGRINQIWSRERLDLRVGEMYFCIFNIYRHRHFITNSIFNVWRAFRIRTSHWLRNVYCWWYFYWHERRNGSHCLACILVRTKPIDLRKISCRISSFVTLGKFQLFFFDFMCQLETKWTCVCVCVCESNTYTKLRRNRFW